MPEEMIRIRIGISVNFVAGAKREDVVEYPRAEWEAMTEDERTAYLDDCANTMIENHVDCWAYVDGEG